MERDDSIQKPRRNQSDKFGVMSNEPAQSDIAFLASRTDEFRAWLAEARSQINGIDWYLYDILGNLGALGALLGPDGDLGGLAGGKPVADIGAADGDLSFVLERELGWDMDIIDNPPTNMNGLRAARSLRDQLGSHAQIFEADLDTQFSLPRERYGLVLLLGILYHLQNPFFVLRELAKRADYCALSTRVARFAGPDRTPITDLPVAYLVGPQETNNDATNYWMFSPAGLQRIVGRAGWSVVSSFSGGDTVNSDPASADHDERQFMLLKSTLAS
jgi:tRNA (mo5U34)-methyltransferase